MDMYDIIYESLQEKVENGELALEDAEIINDAAYNRYVVEASKEDSLELIDKLRDAVESGKATLDKDAVECIKKLVCDDDDCDDDDEDDDEEPEDSDETKESCRR